MKTTLKDIKELAKGYNVEDITYIDTKGADELREKEGMFWNVAYSAGVYGVTGKVIQGRTTGKLYAITSRTSAIFMF